MEPNLITEELSSLEGAQYIHREQILKYNYNANNNSRLLIFLPKLLNVYGGQIPLQKHGLTPGAS